MKFARKTVLLCALGLSVVASAAAQFGQQAPQAPKIPTPFTPVVGSGAQYDVTTRDGKMTFTYAVVGKEQVDGNDAYWLEVRSAGAMLTGEMVIKELTLGVGTHPEIKRMIMQPPGRSPMEMPAGMMDMMKQHMAQNQKAQQNGMGEKIGTESITVPGGTFECDHFRRKENEMAVDYWISSKVPPYSLVKMSGPDTSMVLEKVLTGESTHIKGEPQKMEMPDF
ncbi:MAG TPA: hypothetical protein VFQ24_12525 [Terriglobia bacterium]|nr:hypothetical protein [Terriglobia bacterium]